MDKYYIPRYLDEPMKIAFLTIDELFFLVAPILFGLFIFNSPVIGLLVGSALLALLKSIKSSEGHYFIYHLAYWYLPAIVKFKSTPPSHLREFLG